MPAVLLTPPTAEPLSFEYANRFLRVEHDADDELIAAMIAAARGEIELATRRAGLRGAGAEIADEEVAKLAAPGGAAGYVRIVSELLAATFGEGPA
jgi:hypothetical protein